MPKHSKKHTYEKQRGEKQKQQNKTAHVLFAKQQINNIKNKQPTTKKT